MPGHTSQAVIEAKCEYGYELHPHPLYSSDLAPCHFHLFSRLKHIWGRRTDENSELNAAMEDCLGDQYCLVLKGTIVGWLERLGYGAESRRKVVSSRMGFAVRLSTNPAVNGYLESREDKAAN